MIAVTLDAAPAEYQAVLTSEQRVKGVVLKQADLEVAMNQHWRQIKKKGGAAAADEDEAEIIHSTITCYECHEQGHKANKCPKRRPGAGRGQGGRGEGHGGCGNGLCVLERVAYGVQRYEVSEKQDRSTPVLLLDEQRMCPMDIVGRRLVVGNKKAVDEAKQQRQERFDCNDVGELKEYVGCKVDVDRNERSVMLTQPVLLQSYVDEFNLSEGVFLRTPAIAGDVLMRGEVKDQVSAQEQKKYHSGVGKPLHMMRWSRPECLNSVQELSRFMQGVMQAHVKDMHRVMKCCVGTPNRGIFLKPNVIWDGNPDFSSSSQDAWIRTTPRTWRDAAV
jgi:hypothetical protein